MHFFVSKQYGNSAVIQYRSCTDKNGTAVNSTKSAPKRGDERVLEKGAFQQIPHIVSVSTEKVPFGSLGLVLGSINKLPGSTLGITAIPQLGKQYVSLSFYI